MTADAGQFAVAITRIDEANAPDAATVEYSRRMTAWLERLEPAASDALQLSVRAQHLRRWTYPRDAYPMTRAGYHQWRTAAARGHAEDAAKILRDVGYDEATVSRVQSLIRKENLKTDAEAQTLEDVACLAFLEDGFAEFAAKHDEAKVVGIVQRTWRKMSPRGQQAALTLNLSDDARRIIERALSPQAPPIAPAG
jgi:hypothetical protein